MPETAEAIAYAVQQSTPRDAAAAAKKAGRLPYSPSTFHNVAHRVGESLRAVQADIELRLSKQQRIPDEAYSISISIDRVSVPMEEPRQKPRGRPRKNAPKKFVQRRFRMAYVGTVTLHDENGNALLTLRYGCMPKGDPEALCESMANDVYAMIGDRCDLKINLLADGAAEMWNLLEQAFPEQLFGPVTRRIDFWHLIEKLSPAAIAIFGDEDGKQALGRWKQLLRTRSSAAGEILDELVDSGLEWTWVGTEQPVHDAITYITNHRERMDYAAARRDNLPIGSGNVEATCKTLVSVRMKRAGSRWHEETGEHVIRLRALALSDRWDAAMTLFHESRATTIHLAWIASGRLQTLTQPERHQQLANLVLDQREQPLVLTHELPAKRLVVAGKGSLQLVECRARLQTCWQTLPYALELGPCDESRQVVESWFRHVLLPSG